MPNRYRREERGRGRFEERPGRDHPDRDRDDSYTKDRRSDPAFRDTTQFGREENYFGSGRQGYGDGYTDYQPNSTFGYDWRDSTGSSNYDYPERRYDSARRRAGFSRDAYGLGYGGDWEPEANRNRARNESFDRNRYEDTYASRLSDRDYQSSERGFNTGRSERGWWDRASDEVSSWFGDEEAERRRSMDARPGHRGRGPKNYTRSDDRIREDINDRLTDYDYIDASDIDVAVQSGEVVLAGFVETRYEKRLAEDVAESVSGVRNVENRIRVGREQSQYSGSNLGYDKVGGHTELNRQEADATHTGQSKTATGRS